MSRRFKVLVCRGPTCGQVHGSQRLREALDAALEAREGLEVEVGWQSCFGRCSQGPNCLVRDVSGQAQPERRLATMPVKRGRAALYSRLRTENMVEIVEEHIVAGRVVRRLLSIKPKAVADADHVRPQVLTSVRGPEGGNR